MGAMDDLLDETAVSTLSVHLAEAAGRSFDHVKGAARSVEGLKLRARVDVVEAALRVDLHSSFAEGRSVVRSALEDPEFAGWTLWPVGEAITTLALGSSADADFDDGLAMMAELTPRFTSEFAIRRLLARDLDRSLLAARRWTEHADPHVRRLASEGTRPYLPWAVRVPAIVARPDATIPLLDALAGDPDEAVRRSVANHLNDLNRHAPELVIATARRWLDDPDDNTTLVVRHALRTMVKRGNPDALALRGFAPAEVRVDRLTVTPLAVTVPGEVEIAFDVTNLGAEPASLAVDYVVRFRKKSGTLADKVFKLAERTLSSGETVTFTKRHALRQMTTRVLYAGAHEIEVQVNGKRHGRAAFDLIV